MRSVPGIRILRTVAALFAAGALVSCSSPSRPAAGRAPSSAPRAPVFGGTPAASTTVTGGPTTTLPRPLAAPTAGFDRSWLTAPADGVWVPAGRTVGGNPAVYVTTVHHDGQPVGIAWMDTSRLRFALYAGTTQPKGIWSNDGSVPRAMWGSLVAAMNSGFQLKASMGGWFLDGVAAEPLLDGAASLVIYQDGSATVGDWGTDVTLGPSVVAVRQNLTMLVERGAPTPAVDTPNPKQVWGAPFHGHLLTWRSALGVDPGGHLLYLAGPNLDPQTLAAAMVAAGARRAMELDINPSWDNFDVFTGTGKALAGQKLLPIMYYPPEHFLSPFWRDFVVAFGRAG